MKKNRGKKKLKIQIVEDQAGHKVVVLPEILFRNKQNIDWNAVESYLEQY